MRIELSKKKTSLGFLYSAGNYFSREHSLTIYLIWGLIRIVFPWKCSRTEDEIGYDDYSQYGIFTYGEGGSNKFNSIFICFGKKLKTITMPWAYIWIYTAFQTTDGRWFVKDWRIEDAGRKTKEYFDNVDWFCHDMSVYNWIELHADSFFRRYHYRYERLGQESDCRYVVCERCWRPIMFKHFNIFNFKRRMIEVDFKEEMGPRRGSWNGGTTVCEFDMMPGETPEECIRRMEKEYEFR